MKGGSSGLSTGEQDLLSAVIGVTLLSLLMHFAKAVKGGCTTRTTVPPAKGNIILLRAGIDYQVISAVQTGNQNKE